MGALKSKKGRPRGIGSPQTTTELSKAIQPSNATQS